MLQTRLRVWFGGLRTRLTRRMNQEAKYQLGLRERELMLHVSEKEKTTRDAGQPTSEPAEETPQNSRPASTCELIVTSLLEQAKTLMTEVAPHDGGFVFFCKGPPLVLDGQRALFLAAMLVTRRNFAFVNACGWNASSSYPYRHRRNSRITNKFIHHHKLYPVSPFQVQDHRNGSRETRILMASVTKMAVAAKLAENRIRLDIGDDLSIEDEVMRPRA